MNKDKRVVKILIFMGMFLIFLVLFFILALIVEIDATAKNLKQIKILEKRIEILENH